MIRRSLFALLLIACGPAWAASNCITSGDTTKYTYFVAVDSTDKTTRETGLSNFTVYRSRNGGTATAFTTPTINETSPSNMPGVYELLLDEDMTIDSGDDVQHMVLHITHAGMEPVTKEICIARAKVTAGETLTVSSGAVSTVSTVSGDIGGIAPGGLTLDAFASDTNPLFGIVRRGTAQSATSTTLVLDSGASFADDVPNGMILVACGSTQGYCQSRVVTDYTGSSDTATVSTWGVTPSGTITYYLFGTAPSAGGSGSVDAGAIAEAVASELGTGTQFTAIPWNSAWDAEVQSEVTDALNAYDPPTNAEMEARTLPSASYATASALTTVGNNVTAILEDTGTTLPGTLSTIAGYIDTEVAAIKAVTDNLPDSGALSSLATASALSTVGSVVDAIKVTSDKLDTMLESDESNFKFTSAALAETPVGEGGGLDAAGIRNAIGLATANLDTQLSGISAVTAKLDDTLEDQGNGTYGFTAAALQEAPTGGGSGGDDAETIAQAVATELGDGSGFTAITDAIAGLNDVSTSDVQSAVISALNTYDPPTHSELTSALGNLNDLSAAEVQTAAEAAINAKEGELVESMWSYIIDPASNMEARCAMAALIAIMGGDVTTTGNSSTYEDPTGTATRATTVIVSAGNRTTTITCPSY